MSIKFTRINNDINGNPRYVCHFLNFKPYAVPGEPQQKLEYSEALKMAKKLGGRKFHNKQYGGGIVFQSYNIESLGRKIEVLTGHAIECKNSTRTKIFNRELLMRRDGTLKNWFKAPDGFKYSRI